MTISKTVSSLEKSQKNYFLAFFFTTSPFAIADDAVGSELHEVTYYQTVWKNPLHVAMLIVPEND